MFSVLGWFVLILQCDAFGVIVLSGEPRRVGRPKTSKSPPPPPQLLYCILLLYCWPSQSGSSDLVL